MQQVKLTCRVSVLPCAIGRLCLLSAAVFMAANLLQEDSAEWAAEWQVAMLGRLQRHKCFFLSDAALLPLSEDAEPCQAPRTIYNFIKLRDAVLY